MAVCVCVRGSCPNPLIPSLIASFLRRDVLARKVLP